MLTQTRPAIAFAPVQALTFRRQEALAPRRVALIQLSLRKGSRVIPIMLLLLSVALFRGLGRGDPPTGAGQLPRNPDTTAARSSRSGR